jgi:hypothetical protein
MHYDSDMCIYCTATKAGVEEENLLAVIHLYWSETKRPYSRSGCDSCGNPDEPYMLLNSLWKKVTKDTKHQYLCLSCVETKLGRPLKEKDFSKALINWGCMGHDVRAYIKFRTDKKAAKHDRDEPMTDLIKLRLVDEKDCWMCNLTPGIPVVYQLCHDQKHLRDQLCSLHMNLTNGTNPFIALIPKK